MRRTLTKPLNPRLLSSEFCHAMVPVRGARDAHDPKRTQEM
jgi:hypothetical protein